VHRNKWFYFINAYHEIGAENMTEGNKLRSAWRGSSDLAFGNGDDMRSLPGGGGHAEQAEGGKACERPVYE
jgi:hypothetical protein